jgi:hypothetical protein
MGLSDLFKSGETKRREAEEKKQQQEKLQAKQVLKDRKIASYQLRNALNKIDENINKRTDNRKNLWDSAAKSLKNGDKLSAERQLRKYRENEVSLRKLETRRWFCEDNMEQIDNVEINEIFLDVMASIPKIIQSHPNQVIEVINDGTTILDEQTEVDTYLNDLYTEKINGASYQDRSIPSLDDMMRSLQSEVVHSVDMGITTDKLPEYEHENAVKSGKEAIRDLLRGSQS